MVSADPDAPLPAKSGAITPKTSQRGAPISGTAGYLTLNPLLSVSCIPVRLKAWLAAPVLLAHVKVTKTFYFINGSKT